MHNYMQYKPTTIMIHTNTYHDTHHANAYQYVPHYIPRYIPIQTIKSNTYQHVHIASLMIKLLGNDLWHDSESIVAKVFRQTGRKWKVMFDSHVETCSDWTGSHFSLSEFSVDDLLDDYFNSNLSYVQFHNVCWSLAMFCGQGYCCILSVLDIRVELS